MRTPLEGNQTKLVWVKTAKTHICKYLFTSKMVDDKKKRKITKKQTYTQNLSKNTF